jgi:hypothetical protein
MLKLPISFVITLRMKLAELYIGYTLSETSLTVSHTLSRLSYEQNFCLFNKLPGVTVLFPILY